MGSPWMSCPFLNRALTRYFIDAMLEDETRLGIQRPDIEPRATEHISEIIAMIQQLRKSITALALLAACGWVSAQPATGPLALKPDAPERYIVVPGDTLWSISGRYTDSPWRWPELWGMNRDQIRNPDPGALVFERHLRRNQL